MTDPIPPDHDRPGDLMADASLVRAMVQVEAAWLEALVRAELVPEVDQPSALVLGLLTDDDLAAIPQDTVADDPVGPLVELLRSRADGDVAPWLHHGLSGQDVLDTATVLVLRDALDRVVAEVKAQVATLSDLAERSASTPFGAAVVGWLDGVIDSSDLVLDARALLPVQLGGASGTLAATTDLAEERGHDDPLSTAAELVTDVAEALDLRERRPWHTSRGSFTRAADALVACTDVWGGLAAHPAVDDPRAADVRGAALAAPDLGATLHLASAVAGGPERESTWLTEWPAVRALARLAVTAAAQTSELLAGIEGPVDDTGPALLGVTEDLVVEATDRARVFLEENA